MKRRHLITLAMGTAATWSLPAGAGRALPLVEVYKSPHCGCCDAWVEHMRAAGFTVAVKPVDDPAAIRRRTGLPERFGSCHTALVGAYAVEGHVPAHDVKRLLAARPDAVGLAVPGMPVGSPGMASGPRRDRYDVLLIDHRGHASVFASYPSA